MFKRPYKKMHANPYFDVKYDSSFKKVFSDANVLSSFISSVMQREVTATIGSNSLIGDFLSEERGIIFDVLASDEENNTWIVEMQRVSHPYFLDRLFYYGCRIFSNQLTPGDKYDKLRNVVVIGMVNFEVWPSNASYLHKFSSVSSTDPAIKLEHLIYYVIEIPKYQKLRKSNKITTKTSLTNWLDVFIIDKDVKEMPIEIEPEIKKAYEVLKVETMPDEIYDDFVFSEEFSKIMEKSLEDEEKAKVAEEKQKEAEEKQKEAEERATKVLDDLAQMKECLAKLTPDQLAAIGINL